jgi:hypothetical protein
VAGLDAPAAEDALVGIVAVKRVAVVDFVGLRVERDSLVLDGEQLGRVVNGVVAHRAVEEDDC